MSDSGPIDHLVVALDGRSARSQMQSADIILAVGHDPADAQLWTVAALAAYPGCAVAGMRDDEGRWCVVAVRRLGTVLVRPGGTTFDTDVLNVLARACYENSAAGRSAEFLRAIEEAGDVPARARFVPDTTTDDVADRGGVA